MPTTLTPLRYPGGKSKYFSLFTQIIKDNDLGGATFVEVFAGGAGAAISLLLRGHVESLILNDLDPAIYAFWKSVKEHPEDLIRLISNKRVSMAEWKRQKMVYDQKCTDDPLALGFATFFLNRCNHAGILGARPIGGMKQNGTYTIQSRYNKDTSITKINRIAERAASIEVLNLDAVDLMVRLSQSYQKRKLVIYLDPPYVQKGPALYLNHFEHKNHRELRDVVMQCDFPWVLSYDYDESIMALYDGLSCELYRNSLRHTIMGNSSAEELIISRLCMPQELERLAFSKEDGKQCA